MKTKGIRIFEKRNKVIIVRIKDILKEIDNGKSFYWSILHFYGSGQLYNGQSIPAFENEIKKSEKGLIVPWETLVAFANSFDQVWDILIIGCRNKGFISRYDNDQSMYETCDIVIEMVDSYFWEVFSKEVNLIDKLAAKFNNVKLEFLESDYEK
jgi:hypothetical protein